MGIPRIINKMIIAVVIFLMVIICVIVVLCNTGHNERTSPIEKTTIDFPWNNLTCNYTIWSKTIVSSTGRSIFHTDAYNTIAVTVVSGNDIYWMSPYNSWEALLYIVGMGDTRSDIGSFSIDGCKALSLDTNTSNANMWMMDGIDPSPLGEDIFTSMASFATKNLSSTTWPKYGLNMINDSYAYAISYEVNPLTDPYTHGDTYFTQNGRWQYGNILFSDMTDCLYPEQCEIWLSPNSTGNISLINTLSWGLTSNSKNEMDINFKVPPDPENMTQEELAYYGITKPGGNEYYIDNITYDVT
jgi:hypothetical protein